MFTEITAENLKFFSGNLASEWKEDFSEIDRYPQTNHPQSQNLSIRREKHGHYVLWSAAFVLLISILYLFFLSATQKTDDQFMATQLDKRLMIIEEQIESFAYAKDSFEDLAAKFHDLEIELSRWEANLPASDTLESINVALQHQNHLIQQIFDEVGMYQKPFSVISNNEEKKEEGEFYLVQRRDNLDQISLKTGITIRELRILNSLYSDDQIIAGQSLSIK